MKKIKAFFARVGNYIKNTAWIQPLLIVIVIFVLLFSLAPITGCTKSFWARVTTVNKMDKISYKEYIEKIKGSKEDDKFIIVFTQENCDVCPMFYKNMNDYLKNDYGKKAQDFEIFNVDLSTKSSKVKINGSKYQVYKDKTLGLVSPTSYASNEIIAQDYAKKLDERIKTFNERAFDGANSSELEPVSESAYTYLSTPLVIWYEGGLETRISNKYDSLEKQSDGKKVKTTEFKKYIENFEGETKAEWNEEFDLTFSEYKNIKDAFEEH